MIYRDATRLKLFRFLIKLILFQFSGFRSINILTRKSSNGEKEFKMASRQCNYLLYISSLLFLVGCEKYFPEFVTPVAESRLYADAGNNQFDAAVDSAIVGVASSDSSRNDYVSEDNVANWFDLVERYSSGYNKLISDDSFGAICKGTVVSFSCEWRTDPETRSPAIYTNYSVNVETLWTKTGYECPKNLLAIGGIIGEMEFRVEGVSRLESDHVYLFVVGKNDYNGYVGGRGFGVIDQSGLNAEENAKNEALALTLSRRLP